VSLSLAISKKPACSAERWNARRAVSFCFAATPKFTIVDSSPAEGGSDVPLKCSYTLLYSGTLRITAITSRSITLITISAGYIKRCASRPRWKLDSQITFGAWKNWLGCSKRQRRKRRENSKQPTTHDRGFWPALTTVSASEPTFKAGISRLVSTGEGPETAIPRTLPMCDFQIVLPRPATRNNGGCVPKSALGHRRAFSPELSSPYFIRYRGRGLASRTPAARPPDLVAYCPVATERRYCATLRECSSRSRAKR